MSQSIKVSLIEVTDSLASFGLSHEILSDAILAGEYDRDACTANDPPSSPGFIAWAKTVRALRETLIPLGWTNSDEGNLSIVISPNKQMAILVQTGDEATGNKNLIPKTKYARGPKVVSAILCNQNLHLWDHELNKKIIESEEILEGQEPGDIETWMLMRHRKEDTVFAELSLPDKIGDDARVENWSNRIILSPIKLDPSPPSDEENSGQDIEVPIRRRANVN
jgi:hypothetical protein